MSGVNQQGLLWAKWLKDIWNYKERDLENRKSYMLNPFRASNFAKEILKITVRNTLFLQYQGLF